MRLGKAYIALLVFAIAAIGVGLHAADNKSAGPAQPIDFSHRVHAGDNQISCLYCHIGASRSTAAGVPSVGTCYECHRIVKLKNDEIQKVLKHFEDKQPIAWVRVHSLPDYVYFSHKRHVL